MSVSEFSTLFLSIYILYVLRIYSAFGEGEDEDGIQHHLDDVHSGLWMQLILVSGQDPLNKQVRESLTHAITGHLADLQPEPDSPVPEPGEVDKALKHAFLGVDDLVVNVGADDVLNGRRSRMVPEEGEGADEGGAGDGYLHTAQSQASAIHAFYDTRTRMLHVSNVGACRAVLGRKKGGSDGGDGMFEAFQMAHEHTMGGNEREKARIRGEHPGEEEEEISRFVRLTRAFGMGHLKWGRDVYERLFAMRVAQPVSEAVRSPPYVTAEPEVIRMRVEPGDFLVLGDPGLWDSLTNEEVVGLVGAWKELQTKGDSQLKLTPHELPVVHGSTKDDTEAYKRWGVRKKFLVENSATPAQVLARNVLGGEDELLTYLLVRNEPLPKMWRTHLKCAVVQFE